MALCPHRHSAMAFSVTPLSCVSHYHRILVHVREPERNLQNGNIKLQGQQIQGRMKYSGDLNRELVRYSNGAKVVSTIEFCVLFISFS